MKALKKYTINFASLADGEHIFNYQADNKFLLNFEGALVQDADIEVKLVMQKFLNSLELNFEIQGTVRIPCDVCIEEFDLKIVGSDKISVKIVSEIPQGNDEYNIIYINDGSSSIQIAEMLYELIMLSIPMRKVHPEDKDGNATCSAEILKYLEDSKNNIAENSENEDSINPIWDELKKLK